MRGGDRAAMGRAPAVAVVIILLAVAGAGAYYISLGSSTTPGTTTSSTTSPTTAGNPTTITTMTTSTTSSARSQCLNTSAPPRVNITEMVAEFPEMNLYYSSSGGSNSSGAGTFGYTYLGTEVANGTTYDKVNMSITSTGSSPSTSSLSGNYFVLVAPSGTVDLVQGSENGYKFNVTGSEAQSFSFIFGFFGIATDASYITSIFVSSQYVHQANSSTISYGPTSMQVTTYSPNSVPYAYSYCGESATVQSLKIDLGTVSGNTLLTELVVQASSSNSSSILGATLAVKLISIQVA